jgi:polysaccharide deacetylase family protein (PEP-CTERM system associated)
MTAQRASVIRNAMTVDVEEHFHVQAFAHCISRESWDRLASRVEANIDKILQHFHDTGVQATFFTLGWIAQRHPAMLRRIAAAGHEIASHGWDHTRADGQEPAVFRADVGRSRRLLEDISGTPVIGYRAATFSIGARNAWAFAVLESEGYRYSSSINPVRHDLYGQMLDAPRQPFQPKGGGLWEIPMTTLRLYGRNLPCSGGGWFRLLPYPVFRSCLRRVNCTEGQRGVFYFHPWEIDPAQPRVANAGWRSRFRHYHNLSRMQPRLKQLLHDFAWDRMDRVFADLLQAPISTPPQMAAAIPA